MNPLYPTNRIALIFELSYLTAVVIAVAAFAAALMGGVAGIGTAIVMIPLLTFAVGIREAIPIITVAMLFNNASRWIANRHYVNYKVVFWFWLGAIPGSVLGATAFANLPANLLADGLGIFLLALVVFRHLPFGSGQGMRLRLFTIVGAIQGLLSSLFGGAGPFGAHFFLSYGLLRNAFIGTGAAAGSAIIVAASATYTSFSLLDENAIAIAVMVGSIMVVGAYIGGMIVKHVPDRAFAYIVETIMVVAGVTLIFGG